MLKANILTCEHQDLGSIVLDVVWVVSELLGALHSSHEGLGVSRASPVGVWLSVEDVGSQQTLTADGSGGVLPVHQEHEDNAENGGDQGHPLVVILRRIT